MKRAFEANLILSWVLTLRIPMQLSCIMLNRAARFAPFTEEPSDVLYRLDLLDLGISFRFTCGTVMLFINAFNSHISQTRMSVFEVGIPFKAN